MCINCCYNFANHFNCQQYYGSCKEINMIDEIKLRHVRYPILFPLLDNTSRQLTWKRCRAETTGARSKVEFRYRTLTVISKAIANNCRSSVDSAFVRFNLARTLEFIIGFNRSDGMYGWFGQAHTVRLFYLHHAGTGKGFNFSFFNSNFKCLTCDTHWTSLRRYRPLSTSN